GMLWARSRWSRIYSISPPRLRNSSGSVRADMAPVASRQPPSPGNGSANREEPSWRQRRSQSENAVLAGGGCAEHPCLHKGTGNTPELSTELST
uniref:Uncharacterized protein n=1 Tax=Pavo cristatus TaxID=9049 RepID=A0A8C9EWX2_PAVCR